MKKLISSVLVFALIFSSIGSTFAINNKTVSVNMDEQNIEQTIQQEIRSRQEVIINDVAAQLQEQGALELLDVYQSIIYPQIEKQVLSEYGILETASRGSLYAYAPYGGVASYVYNDFGLIDTQVAVTCMHPADTLKYILKSTSTVPQVIIQLILGYIPGFGNYFAALMALTGIKTAAAARDIDRAGGYGQIINARRGDVWSSVVCGWHDAPYIILPQGAYNHSFQIFPSH